MTLESERLIEISTHEISIQVAKWMQSEIGDHKDRVISVALSGGLDSVCLLLIFKSLGYKLKAVHCNFGLRGEESETDSEWCKHLCSSLEIPLTVSNLDATTHASQESKSIQESARILRYDFFSALHNQGEFDLLALGHHLDDSIESFFINLFRGTGIRGLSGIPARRNFFIRPLLQFSKQKLQDFAQEFQIDYREDSSNQKDAYLRNQIRINLLPEVVKVQPSYRDIFQRNMAQLKAESQLLDEFVTKWKDENITFEDDRMLISKSALTQLPNPGLLFQIIGKLGFNWKTCADLVSRIDTMPGKIYQSEEYEILVDRHYLIVRPRQQTLFEEFVIHKSEINDCLSLPTGSLVISQVEKKEIDFTTDSNIEYVDAAKLNWPLLIRRKQTGDKFQPLGMQAKHKKVKEYLIDEKVNLFDKENLFILCDTKNIIWLIGNRLDGRYQVSTGSQAILRMEYLPNNLKKITG